VGGHGAGTGLNAEQQQNPLSGGGGAMEDGLLFLLGMCLGSLMMLFAILRAIAEMHSRLEQNQGKR